MSILGNYMLHEEIEHVSMYAKVAHLEFAYKFPGL